MISQSLNPQRQRMRRYFLLLCLLPSLTAFSQANGPKRVRSKIDDYSGYITTFDLEGKEVQILRIPPEKVTDDELYRGSVYFVQSQLDEVQESLKKGIDRTGALGYLRGHFIQLDRLDSFPLRYYREEAKAYQDWQDQRTKRQIAAIDARAKRAKDSLYVLELQYGYKWITPDSVWVKQKPDAKAPSIGLMYRLSYVKAYKVEDKPDWVEIDFADHTGYVLLNQIAHRWEDMELTEDELEELKKGRYFNFVPTTAYKAQRAKEEAELERANTISQPKRNYITGPKGGCYYIDSRGKKVYVDHSYCR